jgi:hypothetical protein
MKGRVLALVLSTAVAVSLVTCGGGGGGTPTTPSPPAPAVSGVALTGPEAAAKPGESAQFSTSATLSNGTSQNVTGQAAVVEGCCSTA